METDDHPHRPGRSAWLGYSALLALCCVGVTWWVAREIQSARGESGFFLLHLNSPGPVGGISRGAAGFLLLTSVFGAAWFARRLSDDQWLHGSARFADWRDLQAAGLLSERGIVLGQVAHPVTRRLRAIRHTPLASCCSAARAATRRARRASPPSLRRS